MEIEEKINIRGEINALNVGEKLTLPKNGYAPSTVRSTTSSIKSDTEKSFSVSVGIDTIVIIRKK